MVTTFFKKIIIYRWLVVMVWIALAISSTLFLPQLAAVVNKTDTSFLPKDADTVMAEKWVNAINPDATSKTSAIVVLHNQKGITEEDRTWFYDKLTQLTTESETYTIANILSVNVIPSLSNQLISEDGTLEMAQINLINDVISEKTQTAIIDIRDIFAENALEDTYTYLTGGAAITVDFKKSSDDGLRKTEYITLILVLSILLIVFRSPITPWIPLFVVAVSFVVTTGLVAWAAELGMPISSFTQAFLIAVMFGAGTDYCILIMQRFREELANGLAKTDAILITMQTVGKTVLYAGSTVLIAFSIIGFSALNTYASATGVAIGIAVTLLASITLVPALMMIFGAKLFWPIRLKIGQGHGDSKVWSSLAYISIKRPIVVIVVMLMLVSPLIYFFQGQRSFDDLAEIDASFDSVVGFRLIEEKFSSGEVFPVTAVLSDSTQALRDPQSIGVIGVITQALSQLSFVDKVRSISQPTGEAPPLLSNEQQMAMLQSPEYQEAMNIYTSSDGQYSKIEIILKDNPYSETSLNQIPIMRDTIEKAIASSPLQETEVQFAGTTAAYYELEGISQSDLVRTMILVVIGIFIVLMVMLRSFIAPVYILLSLTLNYLITMGLLELVFVKWLSFPGLSWTVSFFTFVIIVALGVDYSIFLMARIKEEYTKGNIVEAIRKTMVSTGGVITSAAAIMGGTFSAFMFSGVTTLVQIGAGIAIGLALYTFLFMGLIVPAVVRLLGDNNSWPFKS